MRYIVQKSNGLKGSTIKTFSNPDAADKYYTENVSFMNELRILEVE